jgi:DNA-binding LacI/PurR family transcriptional regulator
MSALRGVCVEQMYVGRVASFQFTVFAMEHLPKRTSLVHATATTLKEWISTGMLSEVLPGELQLKGRLGVGRDTLRLALKLLTDQGWVEPAAKGQQRRVHAQRLSSPKQTDKDQLPVTFLSPHRIEHRVTLLEMEDTQMRLAEQGRKLRFLSPDIFHLKHPERQLERLVHAHPSAAWILYMASEPIQHWFAQRGLPTFLYEWPFPGVNLPYVVADWEAAAFHAGLQFIRHGHRILGILEYEERRPGLVAEEQGLQRALATVGNEGRLVVFKDDRSPPSVAKSLDLAFSLKERPTALVLTRATQVLTCFSWLASKGIRIPGDVSIVSLPNDSWFADLYPALSYYEPNTKIFSRDIAQRVMELVGTGRVTRKSIKIPLKYVAGATIGPVPRARG